jgi:hypothetical protein
MDCTEEQRVKYATYMFSRKVMYKFDVLAIAIARVVVRVALQKYEIESTGNRVCEKLILNCLN